VKQWSTKDLRVLAPPAHGRPGDAILTFTDRYSVFDYGVMPDRIPGKGRASCAMAVHSFALLAKAGVTTHFVERVDDCAIRIRFLGLDLSGASPTGPSHLIPLQIVYRRALRPESSVHRRIAAGQLDPALLPPVSDTGRLQTVLVEFTSKFEETDRFLTEAEAARIGGVSPQDLTALAAQARRVCEVVERRCAAVGLTLVDGKTEYGFGPDRELMMVDHAGTPDENRFYHDGVPVCKELLRSLYPGLRDVVRRCVREGLPRDRWPRPEPLKAGLAEATSEVYTALAALWTTGTRPARERLSAAVTAYEDACAAVRHDHRSYR
jgi:phosphoribosylaminoimidazole-succinocarboxamide synthase